MSVSRCAIKRSADVRTCALWDMGTPPQNGACGFTEHGLFFNSVNRQGLESNLPFFEQLEEQQYVSVGEHFRGAKQRPKTRRRPRQRRPGSRVARAANPPRDRNQQIATPPGYCEPRPSVGLQFCNTRRQPIAGTICRRRAARCCRSVA